MGKLRRRRETVRTDRPGRARMSLRPRREDGVEALQFIVIAMTITVSLIVVFAFMHDGEKKGATRDNTCVSQSDQLLDC